MEITLNIGNVVMIDNGKLGTIVSQLGKETKDPNEELWFEVKNEDFEVDHYPLSRLNPDLFEHYESLPVTVQWIIGKYGEADESYENCAKLVAELEAVGYTCDYYLDAVPYYLHKIN